MRARGLDDLVRAAATMVLRRGPVSVRADTPASLFRRVARLNPGAAPKMKERCYSADEMDFMFREGFNTAKKQALETIAGLH